MHSCFRRVFLLSFHQSCPCLRSLLSSAFLSPLPCPLSSSLSVIPSFISHFCSLSLVFPLAYLSPYCHCLTFLLSSSTPSYLFFLISNVSFLFIAYLSLLPSFYHICLALYLLTFLVVPVFLFYSCYRLCLILPSSRDRLCLSLIFLLSRLSHSYLLLIIPIVSPLHSSHLVILMRFILPFNGMFLLHVEFLFLRSKFCRKYDLQAELFVQVVLCAMQGNQKGGKKGEESKGRMRRKKKHKGQEK